MSDALLAEVPGEIEDGGTLHAVAKAEERPLEQPFQRHALAGPRGGGHVLQAPLQHDLREAGLREVVEVDVPRHGELRRSRPCPALPWTWCPL